METFRLLADNIAQIIWTGDLQGQCTWFNQYWFDYTGLTEEESLGQSSVSAVHPDDRDASLAKWAASMAASEPYEFELRIRRKDGAYHWFHCRCIPERNAAGEIIRWIGTSRDINRTKVAQLASRVVANTARRLELVTKRLATEPVLQSLPTPE